MKKVVLHEVALALIPLIEEAQEGNEIIITEFGKPAVKLSPASLRDVEKPTDDKSELQYLRHLTDDLLRVILPLGMSLSQEKDLPKLLERILIEAIKICNADGGTLYLKIKDELRFTIMRTQSLDIASGGATGKPILIPPLPLFHKDGSPNESNIACYVALNGQTMNIPNIYEVKSFDVSGAKSFDQRYQYKSISCLTVPLKDNGGKILGVVQLLNAQDKGSGEVVPFNSYLEQIVESLALQASLALQNYLNSRKEPAI
jgi:sigma-B regulation protein RsbU (phosphoserine phosphatase)